MWFSKSNEEVLREFNVDPSRGLSEEEALSRLKKYGANKLRKKKKKGVFLIFLAQLQDWLIYILFVAVIITLFMGEYIDAAIIILVIITNAVLGVLQEVKAGKAIEALQKLSFPQALVRRDGVVRQVDSEKVVPGDILILDAGRFIAADTRLIESANLQIEESALTGESVPSEKEASRIYDDPKTALGDRDNTAFMSTHVTHGRGIGVVVETGMNTEIGKIAGIIISENKPKTPLEIRLDKLGKTIGMCAIGICLLIFIIAMLQGRALADMFLMSVSLAVASIPEGLAAIVAVVLSIGVTIMSRKNAIIRKLPAVETLGSVNIICSDKTGTLTQNKMTVTAYFNLEGEIAVAHKEDNPATNDAILLAKAMVLCSDATYENGHGTGDPTEIALLIFGDDVGIDRKTINAGNKRAGELAFDSDRKLMSVLIEENGNFTVYTKGAIGSLIGLSTHVIEKGVTASMTETHKTRYLAAAEGMSSNALRTLGVAYKTVDQDMATGDMEKNLVFLGLVGMMDPPRTEVKEAIRKAGIAGITTVMITGDHKNTAFAIALELGIAESISQAITGKDIDNFTEKEFSEKITGYRVFARVSPEHKVRIVHALQSQGNVVSMTGDGVNDAPSLQAPLIATQLLWINLLTDSLPAIALGMDPGSPHVMKEQPRDAKESFFSGGAGLQIILGGVLIGALTISAFWYGYYEHGYSPFNGSVPANITEYARTMAFMVLVVCQLFYALALRDHSRSIFRIGMFSNKYLVGAIVTGVLLQLIVIGIPAMQRAFHLQMLDIRSWLIVVFLGLVPLISNEIFKIFIRARMKKEMVVIH